MTNTKKNINLIGKYRSVKNNTNHDYKAKYNKLFHAKMSSSSFLLLYTLFLLDKKAEPLYGKEMLRELESAISADVWKPSHDTHYPVLEALMKTGSIENVKTISDKKYHSITKLGKK